ncbi:BRO-N domain-containing protein [Xylella fastidiosa subsp. multiplex]|uniref:BRO-N domain-containing protein n=1 Tax=Xylella fastidiosa TaxID=2371 RepID=UPI00234FB5D8|nr:Bro-N domain-containing protein [Xylella fastidiosa]MDC7969724.1 Bro-N domain-containing protein [Xylella fastidiosa subsp. multiplex]MDD0927933.1 Bro-N domain-containing protein [Xylella fastidiosa subsp. multiplex]WDF08128.1 Bro-N domain-containing protein [Xylella fastidiosa subsp. multiplex]
MSQSIIPFNFHSHAVRVVMRDGNPWFVAKDVMDALDYAETSNPARVTEHIPSEWKGVNPIHTLGGEQKLLCLAEPGLYFFLGRSDKPTALPFQKWLAGEVLPSIRKTGSYTATGTMVNEDVLYNIWFLCCHFKGLYEMSFDNKVPQALAWLGAKRMGGRLYTHLVDGMDGGVLRIEKAIGPHLEQAAQKVMGNASRHL